MRIPDKIFHLNTNLIAVILLVFSADCLSEKVTNKEIIQTLNEAMIEKYVFPEVGKKMAAHVVKRLEAGAFDSINDPVALAQVLRDEYLSISNDKHIGISYKPSLTKADGPTPEELERKRLQLMQGNYGFNHLKILPGNIGYLELLAFSDPSEEASRAAIASMNYFANVDALIIDLRQNGGGSPQMIQLLSSYFLAQPTHINSFYIRESDSYKQFWTHQYVQGPKMIDVDLYILTSPYTFSAAEEFAYNMKHLKRGTIVGETSGGGAHPINVHYFEEINFVARIPSGRAINPISGTNWEGTGVVPDIKIKSDKAKAVAYKTALKQLMKKDAGEQVKKTRQWALELLSAKTKEYNVKADKLKDYVGEYGARKIIFEKGKLFYIRGRTRMEMLPLAEDTFWFNEVDNFRLHFERNKQQQVAQVIAQFSDGRAYKNVRLKK